MAWQKRGKYDYYYSWRKRASGLKKVYFGRGPAAAVVALRDQIAAAEETAARAAFDEFVTAHDEVSELLRDSHTLAKQLVSAEMILAGYHRRMRGPWRKRQ